MPTFSFSSQGGTSLSDRIAMINARQKAKMAATQDEEVAEEALMQQVKQDLPDTQESDIQKSEDVAVLSRTDYVSSEMDMLADLSKKVDALTSDVKKMNKHINSIVKLLKRD